MSAFRVAKKVIESLVSAFSTIKCRVLAEIAATVVHWVVNWAVAGRLLRSVVCTVPPLRVPIVLLAGMHLGAMIIITSCGSFSTLAIAGSLSAMLLRGSEENGIVGMSLDVLLQILGALEGLPAEIAFVRLQWDVDSDMGGDMITLDGGSPA